MASDISFATIEPSARPRLGLRGRLALSHLAVIAVAMGLAGLGTLALVRGYLLAALQDQLAAQAELTAAALLADPAVQIRPPATDPAYNTLQQQSLSNLAVLVENQAILSEGDDLALLSPQAIRLTAELPTYVLLLNAQGDPIFQSAPPGPLGLHRSAAMQAALAGDTGRSVLLGEQEDWLVLALPLLRDGQMAGALALAHPLTDLEAVLADTRARLLLAGAGGLALAGLLGLILARRLVQPISQLTAAARQLGQGDYHYPLPTAGQDEIATLGAAFGRMRLALQHNERTRTQFISDVSHELRTPLTGIKGLVETLEDGAVGDPEVRDRFITSIGEETDRLIRLTQDLLTLTRADEHALQLRLEPLELGALIGGVVERLRPEAERHGVLVEYQPPPAALTVRGDADRLEQVAFNLLHNALKHAPQGRGVRVEVKGEDGQAHVRVRDWGPGIPPDALVRVFDRFYRADPARDRASGGSGLGLAIAKALVEQHDGRIWMESPPPDWDGRGPPGALASFTLPMI